MRVIAGTAGSLALKYPKGAEIRPTTDRVREALFNALMADVPGSRFLDLYAGSGSVGIEALSRGAEFATFVDRSQHCIEAITANLDHTGLADRAVVIQRELPTSVKEVWQKRGPFDIVFADPPYETDHAALLEAFAGLPVSEPVLFVLECSVRNEPDSDGLRVIHRQEIGETVLAWWEQP
ncbi:MAG: 16S rRNA (guanine(966)-N(2))-methyltransferase RsmD [Armatimonadota bacterium]